MITVIMVNRLFMGAGADEEGMGVMMRRPSVSKDSLR